MADLEKELKIFKKMRKDLEADALGKWVLIRREEVIGLFDDFEPAAEEAVRRFGRGPYLIRQIGEADLTLPASVAYALS